MNSWVIYSILQGNLKQFKQSKIMTEQKFEAFALIELFGHNRMAGKVTEQTIGGSSFIRIDVPDTPRQPAFTRIINPTAVYAINPITEEAMNELAKNLNYSPIQEWDIRGVVAKAKKELGFSDQQDDDLPY